MIAKCKVKNAMFLIHSRLLVITRSIRVAEVSVTLVGSLFTTRLRRLEIYRMLFGSVAVFRFR